MLVYVTYVCTNTVSRESDIFADGLPITAFLAFLSVFRLTVAIVIFEMLCVITKREQG